MALIGSRDPTRAMTSSVESRGISVESRTSSVELPRCSTTRLFLLREEGNALLWEEGNALLWAEHCATKIANKTDGTIFFARWDDSTRSYDLFKNWRIHSRPQSC